MKEACRRLVGQEITVSGQQSTWDMVPYDVQLVGAIGLHRGKVAEMATGEGKTLVATMPLYLNALAGRGSHLVTVNSYLAQRDAEWMGTVFNFLGLTVDVIDRYDPGSPERQAAYRADITYGTNNEFGFDYLRDNMVHQLAQKVQREYAYPIVDEIDSILIDEARTPLIISGPVGRDTSTRFKQYNPLVASLYKKQMRIANELVSEAEKHLEAGEEFDGGEKLFAVKRGSPRHRKLMKLFADDPSLQTLVNKVEADYMREKRLHELDELLYFAMDEKGHNVHLSDRGLDELAPNDPDAFVAPDLSAEMGEIEESETLSLDDKRARLQELEAEYAGKSQKMHVIHQLLKAYTLFHKDERYIIGEDGQIVIVDEFTGRQMAGRRWSDGLHQAVEAKEGVEIRGETQTLATITIQFLMVAELPEENEAEHEIERHEVEEWVLNHLRNSFHHKIGTLGEHAEQIMSFIMLSVIDEKWKDHLYDLDHLKASIGFRGWGQKDPLVEYKKEAYEMFVDLTSDLRKTLSSYFFRAQFGQPQQRRAAPQRMVYSGPSEPQTGVVDEAALAAQRRGGAPPRRPTVDELGMSARAASAAAVPAGPDPRQRATNRGEAQPQKAPVTAEKEPGRNDPCPCGSGKKYNKCHGRG